MQTERTCIKQCKTYDGLVAVTLFWLAAPEMAAPEGAIQMGQTDVKTDGYGPEGVILERPFPVCSLEGVVTLQGGVP